MAVAGGRCPGPGQHGRRRRRLSRAAAMILPPQPRCQSSRCAWSSAGQRTGPGCERRSGRGWRGSEGAGDRARKAFSPAPPFFPPSLLLGFLGGSARAPAGGRRAAQGTGRGAPRVGGAGQAGAGPRAGRREGAGPPGAGRETDLGPGRRRTGGQGPGPGYESDSGFPSPGPREAPWRSCSAGASWALWAACCGSPVPGVPISDLPRGYGPGGPRRASQGDLVCLPLRAWAPPGNSRKVPRQLWAVARG